MVRYELEPVADGCTVCSFVAKQNAEFLLPYAPEILE